MKIIKLQAQNIKNLKAVEIAPDGNVVTLTGRNGAGKSAVLDAIYSGLTGAKLEDIVRHGQEQGFVEIDLGDLVVRRVYVAGKDRVEIRNKDGLKYPAPQTTLDNLIGKLTFDPLAFLELKPAAQRELLMKMVGLDFKDLDERYSHLYENRTEANREIKRLEAVLDNWEDDPMIPDQEISMTEQVAKVRQLQQQRQSYLDIERQNEDNVANCARLNGETEQRKKDIRDEIARLQAELVELEKIEPVAPATTPLPLEITEAQINEESAKLDTIEQRNAEIRGAREKRKTAIALHVARVNADDIQERIDKVLMEKKTRVLEAKMPIEGLAVDSENVLLADVPLQRLSTGQQIRISTAIAMALNPTIKIILIREGSLLDAEGKKIVQEMAAARDYQLWSEEVADAPGAGIYIEDGEVKQ